MLGAAKAIPRLVAIEWTSSSPRRIYDALQLQEQIDRSITHTIQLERQVALRRDHGCFNLPAGPNSRPTGGGAKKPVKRGANYSGARLVGRQ